MSTTQNTIQTGSLRRVPRASGKWSWEWRYVNPVTGHYESKYLPGDEYPTEEKANEHLEPFRRRVNVKNSDTVIVDPTVGDLLDRYIAEEKLVQIKNRRPGDRTKNDVDLAYSTVTSYLSLCNTIRARWGTTKLDEFDAFEFQTWLKGLKRSGKSKGHLKAFMNRLFNKARLFKMVYFLENPIGLVEVRGISKRRRKPMDLTVEQFYLVRGLLPEPYGDMSMVSVCTGLRVDESLALQWSVIDFEQLCMKVQEGVVNGRIGPVKTEYSEDDLPLDPDFASFLLDLKRKSNGRELVFPSPVTGRSYHASPIQQDYIRRAGWCLVACTTCGAVPGDACNDVHGGRGKVRIIPVHDARRELATKAGFGSIGWHTFRHTYRSLLSGAKTALDVQQKLMRQAQISTTMQYGGPPMDNRRRANSKVVRRILRQKSAQQSAENRAQ